MTPNVPNGGRSVPPELVASKGMTEDGQKRTVDLGSQTRHWATPRANDAEKRGNVTHRPSMPDLVGQSQAHPTPRGTDGTKGGPNQAGSKGDLMLPSAAAQWPTPSASIANDGESPETWHARAAKLKENHGNGNGAGLPLTIASVQWPTPAARDAKGANSQTHCTETGGGRKHMDQLSNFVAHSSHQAQPTQPGPTSSPNGHGLPQPSTKRLNPYFTEWLMGWPEGWTSTTALPASSAAETALYHCKLRQQLSSLFAE